MHKLGLISNASLPIAQVTVKILREEAKSAGATIRVYGRFKSRKETFKKTGRKWSAHRRNQNDVYTLTSAQATYAYGWAIYMKGGNSAVAENLKRIIDGHNAFLAANTK